MTWFLKTKIKDQQKLIMRLQNKYVKAINKYNELVNEYNNENSFSPIGVQPQQTDTSPSNSEVGSEVSLPEEITEDIAPPQNSEPSSTKPKIKVQSPAERKAFGERMKKAREEAKKKRKIQKMEEDAIGIEME